ncbi:Alpha/beta hydrolase fold-3 [Arabidopsis thaliana x Arabidopsis arenosa]|uniref:Alpha/beta hydrolase fold-3 n=1 Tax=Arabidopsis thaliana x Arabidopsis arenosa TaxID=1240361 RepID=A0A8T1XRH2_9BRAS|nr:Alpha/beta hydrolase fold-3 [Arabidopsis thaliana x Arabidopsis arenosa]
MAEPTTPISDPYAYLNIVKNPDGSITRDLTNFPCATATPDPSPENPAVSKDLPVNHSKSTWLRLYLPSSAVTDSISSQKLPIVVYYHGGGFILCSVDMQPFHDFCSEMARDLNAIVVSPSYRLAPEHRLPAAYGDGVEALEWIKTSDDEWIKSHADFSNVFLMGTSAGGNLAYNVGLRSADSVSELSPLQIRGLILHHPFFGGEERSGSEIRLVNDQVCPPIVTDVMWDLSLPVGADRDHEYSNPTVGDGSDDLEKIGGLRWKVMMIGGEDDPMIDRQIDVAKLMKKKGVEVVEQYTDGDAHGAEIRDPCKRKTLFVSIKNFISSLL